MVIKIFTKRFELINKRMEKFILIKLKIIIFMIIEIFKKYLQKAFELFEFLNVYNIF